MTPNRAARAEWGLSCLFCVSCLTCLQYAQLVTGVRRWLPKGCPGYTNACLQSKSYHLPGEGFAALSITYLKLGNRQQGKAGTFSLTRELSFTYLEKVTRSHLPSGHSMWESAPTCRLQAAWLGLPLVLQGGQLICKTADPRPAPVVGDTQLPLWEQCVCLAKSPLRRACMFETFPRGIQGWESQ